MNQQILDFIQYKRFAVVGVSRSGKKFGSSIYTELKARGYQVSAVHPEMQQIEGDPVYPNLAALRGKVDGVIICVTPQKAVQVVRDAVDAGITHIWLQQGAQSAEALAAAQQLGVTPVSGKCILMYAQPVRGFHTFHRTFARLFGQL